MSAWYGVGAPAGTRAEIIDTINREINAALADSNMAARLAEQGGIAMPGSPADFAKFIAEETEKWAKVIRTTGLKLD